ncbi:MAG TPA: SDR family oxidoreductase [Rhizomicrobium sp.]|nr:SDR family oxidoreductase [Rhizomicrobium sp.]
MKKIALVTGAGSGIGRAVALALGGAGYALVLAGRRREALEETASRSGAEALVHPADVRAESAVESLFSAIRSRHGRLDLLFNNAGTNASAPVDGFTLAQWNEVVAVNLTGMFLCAREAFRMMKAQDPRGGRIVNNGSIAAHTPRPYSIAYTATKHAVTGLTKSLSLEGRAFDIACGQIDIGNAATEMTAAMQRGVPQASGALAVEPTFDARHVADAVLYMAALPLDANVQFMTVMATAMPFVGRG